MSEQTSNCCGSPRYNMVFACSGAADVGAISDRAARRLAREKTASMCCTAAIGADIPDIVASYVRSAHGKGLLADAVRMLVAWERSLEEH